MKIIVVSDTVATESNLELFKKENVINLVGKDIYEKLHFADIVIANLEAPLYDSNNAMEKFGPNLATPSKCVDGLTGLNINVVNMANNHIMDHGIAGLENTCKVLASEKINYVGVGRNTNEMTDAFYFEMDGCKLGIYSCAEHEFSCASRKSAGANPFDPLVSFDRVADISSKCDYVIVLYHGGHEFYRLPSPELQRRCRKFIDKGANFVVTQHSHCIGAREAYENGEILYGQGNFIFDMSDNEYTQSGFMISIDIQERKKSQIEYIPIIKKKEKIRIAEKDEKEEIMRMFRENSLKVDDYDYIDSMYDVFAIKNAQKYLKRIHGNNTIFKIINKLTKGHYISSIYSKNSGLGTLNYIECETHNELLIRIIKNNLK